MRFLIVSILICGMTVSSLHAQDQYRGFEFIFSLIHPERRIENYTFTVDPTLEVLYLVPLSEKFLISGGFSAQLGQNNWEELTSHMFWDGRMWWPGRAYYHRKLTYFCMGIPLKVEKRFANFLFNSVFIGITGGRYFIYELTDSTAKRVIALNLEYDPFFYELQLGFLKHLFQCSGLSIGISPVAGVRIHHTSIYNLNEYAWYGMNISTRISK